MRGNFIRHISIIRLAALALLALCIVQPQVHGHPTVINAGASQSFGEQITFTATISTIGLAPGQKLRYTWANLNDPDPLKREFEPLRILVRLLAADGGVIAQTETAAVDAEEFQFWDFDRDQISLPGEAGTGRLQSRLEVTVTGQTLRSVTDLKQVILKTFAASVEVIDNSSGRTTSYVNSKGFQIISAGKDGHF
jgi:hypothetical protein